MTYFLRRISILAIALLAGITGASGQQTLRVGYPPFAAPLAFIDSKTNLPSGALVDLASAVAKDIGSRVELHPLLGGDMLAALNAKIIDMTAGGLNQTPELQTLADYSRTIFTQGEALVVKKSDTRAYKSLDDLKGLPVGANIRTVYADLLQKAGLDVKTYGGDPAALAAVSAGEIRASVHSIVVANAAISLHPNLQVVSSYEPKLKLSVAFGFRKGESELVQKINGSLAKLMADGTVRGIFAKYELGALIK